MTEKNKRKSIKKKRKSNKIKKSKTQLGGAVCVPCIAGAVASGPPGWVALASMGAIGYGTNQIINKKK